MVRDFDSEIQQLQKQLDSSVTQMGNIYQQFLTTVSQFIVPWYWKETEHYVKNKHEITLKIGSQKLAQLKNEVKGLQEKAPK